MPNLCQTLVDEIAENCVRAYTNLPKTGKPVDAEWTVLSCIVQYQKDPKMHEVVALGTGSKCIGATKMLPQGNILNDSHSEVIARRGFLLYLYENVTNAIENRQSIFLKDNINFTLKDNIEFVFYSSQMPCGDASIIPKTEDFSNIGELILGDKREAQEDLCDVDVKKKKLDIHRTGAKCLSYNQQDLKVAGQEYHLVGQVRTKPGRGDRTLSASCSDKIARWIHCGIQGSLLDLLLSESVFIKYFIFGSGVPYSEETLHRALLQRESKVSITDRLKVIPNFYRSSLIFPQVRSKSNERPAAGSIVWVKTNKRILEVVVQGKKLGVTKKRANNPSSSVAISKNNLYKKYLEVLHKSKDLKVHICGEQSLQSIPYNEMKRKAILYQTQWSRTKEIFFKSWTLKPDIWNFCINIGP
ncbi:tRNA-specific adenosine deaminase 1 [Maniola hyperantus]|uniref:tRNA-specific adenosine deaminase 1 n=1 Tax=Aphantopus hyperantus TaxID=2795564 RepID=UPI00374855BE